MGTSLWNDRGQWECDARVRRPADAFPSPVRPSHFKDGKIPMESLPHAAACPPLRRRRAPGWLAVACLLCCAWTTGCAALSNPGVRAVPVHLLPPEAFAPSVEGLQTVSLSLLGQEQPDAYRIGPGDVLGVWVDGVLGVVGQQPPVQPPVKLNNVDLPPATGFPIQVRTDGTISLPRLKPLPVKGLTFPEAEEAIRRAYVEAEILKEGRERIIVSLVRPRTYHVLVLREDSPTQVQTVVTSPLGLQGSSEFLGVARKGTGWDMILPAYQNDVLTALAKSGGLPGTDANDVVIVERNVKRGRDWDVVAQEIHGGCAHPPAGAVTRIPLRAPPHAPPPFRPEDVILGDGDVVMIPAREERLFYTGGLLPPGEHILPRDKDLDVLSAVARVRGPSFNGDFQVSNLSGTVVLPGMGQPSASLLTVIRRLPDGGQIPIRVDLNRAVQDPRERILVQAGDYLLLQETPAEGFSRFLTQTFDFTFMGNAIKAPWGLAVGTATFPGGTGPMNPVTTQNLSIFSQGSTGVVR